MSTASVGRLAVLVMTLISSLLLAQGVAMATPTAGGTVTFVDLTDTITLSDTTGRTGPFSCSTGEGSCAVSLLGPAGATSSSLQILAVNFTEPGTNVLSDQFGFLDPDISIGIFFLSDTEPGSLGTCPQGETCPAETGLAQTAATVTWKDDTGAVLAVDTIKFQSDVSDVPEPASALLVLTGVGVVAMARRRTHWKTKP